jgi:hypothetical protein
VFMNVVYGDEWRRWCDIAFFGGVGDVVVEWMWCDVAPGVLLCWCDCAFVRLCVRVLVCCWSRCVGCVLVAVCCWCVGV